MVTQTGFFVLIRHDLSDYVCRKFENLPKEELCDVTFHVVVAPEFKVKPGDKVIIQFHHEHLGGFGDKSHVMDSSGIV